MSLENDRGPNDAAALHQRAFEVFAGALRLSGEERRAFLDDVCAGDAALRAEVESLFGYDEASPATGVSAQRALLGVMEKDIPPTPGAEDSTADPSGLKVGDRIGPYELLQQIGEGGFGTVYAAEQTHPLRRRVALKVLKAGMDTKEVIARFDAERNALALLNHPGIARVHDAGATPAGRPYFVMEYVEGMSVTEFCDLETLTVERRLRLFAQICDAVQHAHQMGIIHRDLKPSNLLVTMRDGQPRPKVIDFGIAKATTRSLSEETVFTLQGQLIGTPEYMSPEQAEMSGVGVDSTTDIYALGVVLYELLTGLLPFDGKTLRKQGVAGIHRYLNETETPKPSSRVSRIDAAKTTTVGRHRRTDPQSLRRDLSGELDWIVMRALEKQRTRRYPSASEFAADLRRHLDHEPVLAGPPGAGYRVRKFIRRHRVGVSFAVMCVLLLVGGMVTTTLAMLDADRQREDAVGARGVAEDARQVADEQRGVAVSERDRANEGFAKATLEEARARAVTRFLLDSLGLASPDETKLPHMSMAKALDEAAAQVAERFADFPRNEAEIRLVIGRAYDALGRPDLAFPQLRRVLHLHRHVLDSDAVEVIEVLKSLFRVADRLGNPDWVSWAHECYALILQVLARTEPALAGRAFILIQQAAAPAAPTEMVRAAWNRLRDALLDRLPDDPFHQKLTESVLYGIPEQLGWAKQTTGAAEMIEEILEMGGGRITQHRYRAIAARAMFFRLTAQDYDGAKALATDRIAALVEVLGEDHDYLEEYRSVLGFCLGMEGQHDEGLAMLRHALEVFEGAEVPHAYEAHLARIRMARLHEVAEQPELAATYRKASIDYFVDYRWPVQWTIVRSTLSPAHAGFVEAYDKAQDVMRQCVREAIPPASREPEFTTLARRIIESRRICCADENSASVLMAAHMFQFGELLTAAGGLEAPAESLMVEARRIGGLHPDKRPLFRIYVDAQLRALRLRQLRGGKAQILAREIDELTARHLSRPGKYDDASFEAGSLIWSVVKMPGLAAPTYDAAARWALAALLNVPGHRARIRTCGVALYRAGRLEEAVEQLTISDGLGRPTEGDAQVTGDPGDLAFLCMALHRLGRDDEAAGYMTRLRAVMRREQVAADPDNQAFHAEAEALLASGR